MRIEGFLAFSCELMSSEFTFDGGSLCYWSVSSELCDMMCTVLVILILIYRCVNVLIFFNNTFSPLYNKQVKHFDFVRFFFSLECNICLFVLVCGFNLFLFQHVLINDVT